MPERTNLLRAKFGIGEEVTVRGNPPWMGKVLSIRLRMEDESFVYIVRGLDDRDHVETRPEVDLGEVKEYSKL